MGQAGREGGREGWWEGGQGGGRPRQFVGQYELLETLGKGMSGKVKKARHIRTGDEIALKIIDKSKVRREGGREGWGGEGGREEAKKSAYQ